MASPGNPSGPGGGPFDVHSLFKPSTPPPPPSISITPTSNPNPQDFPNNSTTESPKLVSAPFRLLSAANWRQRSLRLPSAAGYTAFPLPPCVSAIHQPGVSERATSEVHVLSYASPTTPNATKLHFPTPSLQFSTTPEFSKPKSKCSFDGAVERTSWCYAGNSTATTRHAFAHPNQPHFVFGFRFCGAAEYGHVFIGDIVVSQQGPVMRMASSKLPKGRHLMGDHLVYDIDVKFPGEVQPQLEVTPITKYGSDPGLVVGRQIVVNKTYICYGFKLGTIRVLNINTALRSLLKGLTQRVTDMAFFAEDVHLLASASVDGRVYVWKITEGSDEEDKPQITGRIVIAIQNTGEGESVHPKVCGIAISKKFL